MLLRRVLCSSLVLLLGCGRSEPSRLEPASASSMTPDADEPLAPDESGSVRRTLERSHFVNFQIGDCVDFESWLSFGGTDGLEISFVDRNSCASDPRTRVSRVAGSYRLSEGSALQLDYLDRSGFQRQSTETVAVVEPPEPFEAREGYQPGTRALNTRAFVRVSDSEYRSLRSSTDEEQGRVAFAEEVVVTLQFAEPLEATDRLRKCRMFVTVEISAEANGERDETSERFAIDCTYGPLKSWHRVLPVFDGEQGSGVWKKVLERAGVYERYADRWLLLPILEDAFRPVLDFEATRPEVLFSDNSRAWFFEILNEPPNE